MAVKGGIIVIVEHSAGKLLPVSFEVAEFGKRLASKTGRSVRGLVLADRAGDPAKEFAKATGLDVIAAENENLEPYNAEAYLQALAGVASKKSPDYFLIPHTATGWDFAPRLAVMIQGSCITGVQDIADSEETAFMRSICGGKIVAEVSPLSGRPAVVTVLAGAARPGSAESAGQVEILPVDADARGTKTIGYIQAPKRELDLTKAEVIVAAGRGLGGPENIDLIRDLAACFDKGAVGASRPVCDAGWLPIEHQVGQTGQTVSPRLYMACGISGAIQHTIGMAGAEMIVAINTDPRAMIFNHAHIGITMDLHEFLPVLIEKIKTRKSDQRFC